MWQYKRAKMELNCIILLYIPLLFSSISSNISIFSPYLIYCHIPFNNASLLISVARTEATLGENQIKPMTHFEHLLPRHVGQIQCFVHY